MVVRAMIVHCVVGALLACPLLCLAQAAACGSASRSGCCRNGKHCCPSSRPESGKDRPGNPTPGEKGDCLCHGAVWKPTAPPSTPPGEPATVVLSVDDWFISAKSRLPQDGPAADSTACHFAAALSGRMVRALIESLLI